MKRLTVVSPKVSIVIPTLGRPEGLERAVRSLFVQEGVRFDTLELVVVDNDPGRSAALPAKVLGAEAPFPVQYVWESRPGVANARNAGVRATSAPLIAFLDDDQIASPAWLSALLATHKRLGVQAVFGPVEGIAPAGSIARADYVASFFTRSGPSEDTVLDHWFGCGDSLIERDALPDDFSPFCASRNRCGGEDDLLFGRMAERGGRFGWSAEARVQEMIPPERARLSYTLRRAFAFGQGPASAAAAASPPRPFEVLGWMGRGVVQIVLFAGLAVWRGARRQPDWLEALDRSVRGVGKVLWFPPFKISFYGEAAVPASSLDERPHPAATRYRMVTYAEFSAFEDTATQGETALAPTPARRHAARAAAQMTKTPAGELQGAGACEVAA